MLIFENYYINRLTICQFTGKTIKRYPHFMEATFHVKQRDISTVLICIDFICFT